MKIQSVVMKKAHEIKSSFKTFSEALKQAWSIVKKGVSKMVEKIKIRVKKTFEYGESFLLQELDFDKKLELNDKGRIILNVPYSLKDIAKRLFNAKFDWDLKKWTVSEKDFNKNHYLCASAFVVGENLVDSDEEGYYALVEEGKKYFFHSDASRTFHTGIRTIENGEVI